MSFVRNIRTTDVVVLVAGLTGTAAAVKAMSLVRDVSPTTAALALLLVVLATASFGRLWLAGIVALAATLALNFFFLPPVRTFTVAEPQNWVALAAFLLTAVIASKLSAAAQARAREAVARRNEVTRLFDLTRDVLLTTETAGAIDALARHVARRFKLEAVAIFLPTDGGWRVHQGGMNEVRLESQVLDQAFASARGALEFDAHQRAYGGHVHVGEGAAGVLIVPLRNGINAVGLLAAEDAAMDVGTLDAVAGVAAIAIERTQFLGDRKAAELVRQKADLAATLLASLSHDLKTPLTAIRVAVENLGGELTAEGRQAQAGAAVVELDRLNRLFQDILDMARIDASAIEVERRWVTPEDVVDAASAHVRPALDSHPLTVEAESEVELEIDPSVASVALSHLLENAARYSAAGAGIVVRATAEQDGLSVSVTDEGPGLDPAELDHLFERFYRGRSARRLVSGTGMGLAITRGLLAAVGGRVWAENVKGGARFTVFVPGHRRPMRVRS